jgi:hypothetical protein
MARLMRTKLIVGGFTLGRVLGMWWNGSKRTTILGAAYAIL